MRINIPIFTALLELATATPAFMTSLARREECPPYTSCHPECEWQRSNLAKCNCMHMTCGQGGANYDRFKTRYVRCARRDTGAGKADKCGRTIAAIGCRCWRRCATRFRGL
jgi:hypothetical protein